MHITYVIFVLENNVSDAILLDGEEIMKYCDFVKKVRKQLNYTQKELSDALDVSYATVNRWENSQVLPSKLAVKSFLDFCENNFIDISDLEN